MTSKYNFYKLILKKNIISFDRCYLIRQFSNDLVAINNEKSVAWSYLHGASKRPLLGATIGHVMEMAANKNPSKDAFIFPHQKLKLSYQELLEKSDQLAAGLLKLGARKGDRIGIWAPNCLEWILAQYATARAGFILVNINPGYKSSELKYCLLKVGIKILIMAENYKKQQYYDILQEIIPQLPKMGDLIKSQDLPMLERTILIGESNLNGTINFCDVMKMANPAEVKAVQDNQKNIGFDDPINIQFTSGTTGLPKGATLTHHNILNNARCIGFRLNFHLEESKICLPLPMYHCFGMVMGSLQVILHGAACIIPCYTFDPEAAMRAVQKYRCTSLYGTPTMFIDYLNVIEHHKFDVSSLKTGIMSGASCPIELLKRVISQLHMKDISICYGMTENSPVTFQTQTHDSPELRISTVGKIQDHFEAKIINEKGSIVPVGESGEICIRGYGVMQGYWADDKATSNSKGPGNWFKTGDIGVFDSNGYCSIVGRQKDMIIRGGENIYPAEIEQFLHEHDNIKNAQVIGVPDDRLGEEIAVWVCLRDDQMSTTVDDVKTFCRKHMAHFKVPKYVHFVKEYPLTVTGKVQKYKMREESLKIFNIKH